MPLPFDPISLGELDLSNRFVRSATWEALADSQGFCTERLIALIGELARGHLGLLISSHAFVSFEGRSAWGQVAVHDDRFIPGLSRMAEAAHRGGTKIVLQVGHAGIQANRSLTGLDAVGPSGSRNASEGPPRELSPAEIRRLIDAFVAAAIRAHQAGFDGVQVHAAHGYLLSQFLSPHYNRRRDEYGGTTQNRARIVVEIVRGIRRRLGPSFPILLKMNAADFVADGLTSAEMVRVVSVLEDEPIDAIELSGGTTDPDAPIHPVRCASFPPSATDIYYFAAAKQYKLASRIPLILVGGIRSYQEACQLLDHSTCDLVALCRPLIQDPALVRRWQTGDRRLSKCDSCNECLARLRAGQSLFCPIAEMAPLAASQCNQGSERYRRA